MDGVITCRKRIQEKIVPLLGGRTQDQLRYRGFVGAEHVVGRHLYIEDRGLTARGARKEFERIGNSKAIDRHGDLRRLSAFTLATNVLFRTRLRRIVQEGKIRVLISGKKSDV